MVTQQQSLSAVLAELAKRRATGSTPTANISDPNTTNLGNVSGQSSIPIVPTATAKQGVDTSLDTGDPIRKFNLALLDMLKQAQGKEASLTADKSQLEREAYQSGREQFTGQDALMSPDAKMSALNRNTEMYNPSLEAASIKIKQLGDITELLKNTYGQDYSNLIPATKEDAETFRAALQNGATLPTDILTKYAKYFTTDDWAKWAEANKKETAPQTMETAQGIMQWNPETKKWENTGLNTYVAPKATGSGISGTSNVVSKIQDLDSNINQINELTTSPGLNKSAQAGIATGFITGFGGGNELQQIQSAKDPEIISFISSVEQLVSQGTLKSLIDAKSQGATFGALSDRELGILANAFSQIGTWRVEKNGRVIGYNVDSATMKKELNKIQESSIRLKAALQQEAGITTNNDPLGIR